MTGLDEIREKMAEHLRAHGLDAATAYPAAVRKRREGAAAAVSLRGYEGGPAGFQDYLGERYNETTGKWEELYGKKLKLTSGLTCTPRRRGPRPWKRLATLWRPPCGAAAGGAEAGGADPGGDRMGQRVRVFETPGGGGVRGIPLRGGRRARTVPGL